jgi:DNA polymerase III gamma/tau subunit
MAADDNGNGTVSTDLHTRYRPSSFDEVVGQAAVVRSLRGVLAKKRTHAYLFHGPAGTGKTTLGRIIAREVGCKRQNLTEVNAADFTGVDDMRQLASSAMYSGTGGSPTKVYILDECQRLTAQAWSCLLKPVEEPGPHVYWIFCTTEHAKVPQAIRTRCAAYELEGVSSSVLVGLLNEVASAEKLGTPDDVLELAARKALGSPRQALVNLSKVAECKTAKEAGRLLKHSTEQGSAGDLCRLLIKGCTFQQAAAVVKGMKEEPESVRQIVCNWFSKVAMDAGTDKQASRALAVLDAFGTPYPYPCSTPYPVLLSLGRLLLG